MANIQSNKKNSKENSKKEPPLISAQKVNKINRYIYLLILVAGFIIYGNTLTNDYAVDDCMVITNNAFTQKGVAGIAYIFMYDTFIGQEFSDNPDKTPQQLAEESKIVAGGRYRPLSVVTFALEISLFGNKITNPELEKAYLGNPFVSHLINLILYVLTTCLLFKILSTLFPLKNYPKWFLSLPFIATFLFLCHPIHTEAIANIKGRDEIMTLLGALGALWFSIQYCKKEKPYLLLLSGVCLFLGLLSKENAITFLAVIPISLYLFLEKKLKKIFITFIPLFAATLVFLFIRGLVLGFSNPPYVTHEILNDPFIYASFSEKYATVFYTLWLYFKLLFFSHPLTHDYYPVQIEIINFANPKAFIPLLIYLFLTVYAIYGVLKSSKVQKFSSSNIVSFSIWFFLLPLSVVSNLFFSVGTFMNERFVFISSIGFCIFLAWLFVVIIPKLIKNNNLSRPIIITCLTAILCLYAAKTISRNRDWKNDYVLSTTDVKTSSNSARCNRFAGQDIFLKAKLIKNDVTKQEKLFEQAIYYLKKSVELYPGGKYSDALLLLSNVYFTNNDFANSLKYYAKCLSYDNHLHEAIHIVIPVVANKIDVALSQNESKSSPQEILDACDELLQVAPELGDIIYLKASIAGRYLRDLSHSIQWFEEANAIENFEKTGQFYKDMGTAYALNKDYETALFYMLKSADLDGSDFRIHAKIAAIYNLLGDSKNFKKHLAIVQEKENK